MSTPDRTGETRPEPPRCEGRYPVPQPRDEPFDVTYRCALLVGHLGPHRSEPIDDAAIDRPEPISIYEQALRSIAANSCCAPCREAGLVAQKALRDAASPALPAVEPQPQKCECGVCDDCAYRDGAITDVLVGEPTPRVTRDAALRYAIALVAGRISVEAPANARICQAYVEALSALRAEQAHQQTPESVPAAPLYANLVKAVNDVLERYDVIFNQRPTFSKSVVLMSAEIAALKRCADALEAALGAKEQQ